MNELKIKDILGTSITLRARVRNMASQVTDDMVLDFTGVNFTSRSAMDEFCNILEAHPAVKVTNMQDFVSNMFDVVWTGRKKVRVRDEKAEGETITCNTMEELAKFLLA